MRRRFADVAFVLTTNRVDVLEEALVERPGRVDLAVEIARPDTEARRRLFALYAADAPFSAEAIEQAADRSDGVTGSFAKELIRRALLRAAVHGRPAHDGDLDAALDELMDDREALTRRLVGGDVPPTSWSLPDGFDGTGLDGTGFDGAVGPDDAD